MSVVDRSFDHPLKIEESAAMPLAGGLVNMGYQCGMIWGSALAAGAQAYRLYGSGSKAEAEAIIASQRIIASFRECNKEINCLEITQVNLQKKASILKLFAKGGPVICVRMAVKYAPIAYNVINNTLNRDGIYVPPGPASCASMVARKMGMSDMHAVMAAGLAGGIGLSGGGCGALGAAIWITRMNGRKEGAGNKEINARINGIMDSFIRVTAYQYECSCISGRKFEDFRDHASYLQAGGCSKIVDLLASGESN